MDIPPIKIHTVTMLLLAIIPCTAISGAPAPAVDFKSMTGAGHLTEKSPGKNVEKKSVPARLSLIDNITIRQELNCKGVSLTAQTRMIVVVGDCPSGQYFVCPGGSDSCTVKGLNQTKRNNHVYEYKSNFSGLNYVVELYSDRMIYRIQESNCMIPYPHGCLVKAPGWKDVEYIEFIRYP